MRATLHIEAALKNGKTYLSNCFFTTPFKVASITEDRSKEELHLMLMTSSPGILDGDEFHMKIQLNQNAALHLKTQSYQRLFQMKKGASQSIEVRMNKGSSFCYLPQPTVPHKDSNFVANNNIYLSHNCMFIWGELLTCGRILNGEEFAFSKFSSTTKIFLNNRLVVKENLLIEPAKIKVHAIGQLEGYTHQASLIFINVAADIKSIIKYVVDTLNQQKEICFGVSSLPVNGIIIRILGFKAEQLYSCLKNIANHLSGINNNDAASLGRKEKEIIYAN
jgi:urease accessory protein